MSREPKNKERKKTKGEPSSRPSPANQWKVLTVCLFLIGGIWLEFGQTIHHPFVNYDDYQYVVENPVVQSGLNSTSVLWAFTHSHANNWHPLTWMSHMLDCQIYGLDPAGHHLTNILLHTAAALLLFGLLREMTGAFWCSAAAAAMFAIHPLRVESVAWVSERKDLLSGLFFMLTLRAYVRYTRNPWSARRYAAVLALFALGLMAKPMLVTLPFVLLLLDFWPMNRWSRPAVDPLLSFRGFAWPTRLILEKIPFLALSVLSCGLTVWAQGDAVQSFEKLSLPLRLANAVMSYGIYLGQLIYPFGLAVFYPYQPHNSLIILSILALLVLISLGSWSLRKPHPYLLMGWLWYLVMLVPVIGIVQVGTQAHADRYTYLPEIGLAIAFTWLTANLTHPWPRRQWLLGLTAGSLAASWTWTARTQAATWRDSETLWNTALTHTQDNKLARNNYVQALMLNNHVEQALATVESEPQYAEVHYTLGLALLKIGHLDAAIAQLQRALEIDPLYADAHNNLGVIQFQGGLTEDAIAHWQKVLASNPNHAAAHNNLGLALLHKGRLNAAMSHWEKALEINPSMADAHSNLGVGLAQKGRKAEAIVHWKKALEIDPYHAKARAFLDNASR